MKACSGLLCAIALASTVVLAQEQGAGEKAPGTARKPPPAPRVLVLTFGRADEGMLSPVVQSAAERVLLDLRFPLIDESQVMGRYQLEDLERFLILSPERVRMAELKARFSVELICVVQYSRRFQYEAENFGTKSRFFKNDVRVKAILPDTAEIIHSGGGEGTIEARQSGLEELTREHVRRLAEKVLERSSYEAVGPSTYQVFAKGFARDGMAKLESALRGSTRVRDVVERDFTSSGAGEGSALIEVKLLGTADDLKTLLQTITDPAIEIRSSSKNRVEVVPIVRPKND